MPDVHPSPDTEQVISQLSQSLAQAAESQRLLVQEVTVFTKDESLRFANLRLERNGAALDTSKCFLSNSAESNAT